MTHIWHDLIWISVAFLNGWACRDYLARRKGGG